MRNRLRRFRRFFLENDHPSEQRPLAGGPEQGSPFQGRFYMTRIHQTVIETPVAAPANLHELVRGQEHRLLNELEPIVRQHSVTLDMRQIERIDAAGIAALISLYGAARAAGHEFTIINASHRVDEILQIVGLDRILISHENPCPQGEPCYEMPAA